MAGAGEVVTTTTHQLSHLPTESPEVQRRKVLAWIDLSEVDPSTVTKVQLERLERVLDPEGGPSTEMRRDVVAEVPL